MSGVRRLSMVVLKDSCVFLASFSMLTRTLSSSLAPFPFCLTISSARSMMTLPICSRVFAVTLSPQARSGDSSPISPAISLLFRATSSCLTISQDNSSTSSSTLLTLFALTAGISLSVPSASSLTSMLSPARRPRSFAKSLGIETESVEYPTFWSLLVSSKVSIYQSLLYEPYSYTEESTFAEQFGFEEKRLLLDDRRCSRQRGRYFREHLS